MFVVLGGTGHIGKALTAALLEKGEEVIVITHSAEKVPEIESTGAKAAVADVYDTENLQEVFRRGKRLFLLNPPADPASDIDETERRTIRSILSAVKNANPEFVVAASTCGAQEGKQTGDLGTLYELEQGLKNSNIPHTIIRSGYYYSNWDMALDSAKTEGKIYSFFPAGFKLPMVAPEDIGKLAAGLLTDGRPSSQIKYCVGPEEYSANDVAAAFSKALNKDIEVVEVPQEDWVATFKQVGFTEKSAESMANMTRITLEQDYEMPTSPHRGSITIEDYAKGLA